MVACEATASWPWPCLIVLAVQAPHPWVGYPPDESPVRDREQATSDMLHGVELVPLTPEMHMTQSPATGYHYSYN